jgi:NADPH2:quinone reductase
MSQNTPTAARSALYRRNGSSETIEIVERAVAEPGPGEVLVRIHRSGVNPTDWKARHGSGSTAVLDPPQVPNQDGAGVVEAVGRGVDAAWHGVRVWIWEAAYGRPHGTAQDYAIVPVTNIVALPDNASFDLGAGLGVPFLTAHRCLTVSEFGASRLGPGALAGRTVLVSGGAGAVGNAAIQLSRWSDATVITTISSAEKAQLAARAGADHVLNYREQDVEAEVRAIAPGGVDIVVEVAVAANAALDAAVIAPHGVVASYAATADEHLDVPIRALMTTNARWQFVLVYGVVGRPKTYAIEDVSAAALDGRIGVGQEHGLPLHHFPLERTGEAHDAVEQGTVGKVLIDVAE